MLEYWLEKCIYIYFFYIELLLNISIFVESLLSQDNKVIEGVQIVLKVEIKLVEF